MGIVIQPFNEMALRRFGAFRRPMPPIGSLHGPAFAATRQGWGTTGVTLHCLADIRNEYTLYMSSSPICDDCAITISHNLTLQSDTARLCSASAAAARNRCAPEQPRSLATSSPGLGTVCLICAWCRDRPSLVITRRQLFPVKVL